MSASKRLLLVLLVLLLGGGVATIWFGGGRETDRPSPKPVQAPGSSVRPKGLDASQGGETRLDSVTGLEAPTTEQAATTQTTVKYPLEVHLDLAQPGGFEDSQLPPPRGDANARLKGSVHGSKGVGMPCTVTFTAGPNLGRVLQSDSEGRFGASDLYQGLSFVRIETLGGLSAEREISLRQLSQSELNLDLSPRAAAYVSGSVKDLSGSPIEGARVRMDGSTTLTDINGEFEFPRVTPGKVPVTIEKHGFARAYQVFHVAFGRAIARDKLTFTLHPGVDLELRLEAAVGSPGPVQVYILPIGGRSVGTGLGAHTFPWHEINPVLVHPGGSTLIEGLQEGHITILAFHPGAVASPPLVNMKLIPGRKNQHLIRLRAAPTSLRGRVLGVDGKPIRGARVRLEDPQGSFASSRAMGQRRPDLVTGAITPLLPAAVQETTTDGAGRFILTLFPQITAKGYYLTVESPDGSARAVRSVAPASAEVEVQLEPVESRGGQLTLHMGGRYQGLPVELTINGKPEDPRILPAEDDLEIDGLEPGMWRLEVWWHEDRLIPGKQLRIEAERETRENLVLPLPAVEGPSATGVLEPAGGKTKGLDTSDSGSSSGG